MPPPQQQPPIRIPGPDKPAPMPRIPGLEPPKELVPPSEEPPIKKPAEERKAPISLEPRMEQMPRVVFPEPAPKPIRIPEGPPLRIPEPILPPELPEPGRGERRGRRKAPPAPTASGGA